MLVSVTALALTILSNLVNPDLVVPTRDGEEVWAIWGGRESEVRDAVGRGVAQGHIALEVALRLRR